MRQYPIIIRNLFIKIIANQMDEILFEWKLKFSK